MYSHNLVNHFLELIELVDIEWVRMCVFYSIQPWNSCYSPTQIQRDQVSLRRSNSLSLELRFSWLTAATEKCLNLAQTCVLSPYFLAGSDYILQSAQPTKALFKKPKAVLPGLAHNTSCPHPPFPFKSLGQDLLGLILKSDLLREDSSERGWGTPPCRGNLLPGLWLQGVSGICELAGGWGFSYSVKATRFFILS